MIRKLNFCRFLLCIALYLLPLVAFGTSLSLLVILGGDKELVFALSDYRYFGLVLFTTIVWAITSERYRATNIHELFLERTGIRAAVASCVAAYAIVFAALFFYRSVPFSRLLLASSALILLILTFLVRAGFRLTLRSNIAMTSPLRVLMVGADEFARVAADRLDSGPFPCRVVGFVRVGDQDVHARCSPLYDCDEVQNLRMHHSIDDVVIALPPSSMSRMPEVIRQVGNSCVPVRAIVDFGKDIVVRDRLFQFGRLQMLDLANTPAESLDYALLKRAFDLSFAALALITMSPLILLVAIAIRLTSKGPVFFVQDRVGLSGRVFRMFKFRTMHVAPSNESDTRWTTADDDRCTWVGRILRKTSIDELPQFINVLKGDMSVVGPRPERPHFVRQFQSDVAQYDVRHRLKVGITGWAQVNGFRGDTSIRTRIEYDLYYLENWSLMLDLRIIFMTIVGGLVSKNAY